MSTPSPEGRHAPEPILRGSVLILQPDDAAEGEDLPVIRDCLRRAGLPWVESAAMSLPDAEFPALLVRGALAVRGYLNPHPSSPEPLDRRVAEVIRNFFHAGKPIAAPCMGLAVVIEALADLLPGPLILSPESPQGPVAVYSPLRLVTTHRPLIGHAPDEVSKALTQVVTSLQRLLSSCGDALPVAPARRG
jgi:hypothetical protein